MKYFKIDLFILNYFLFMVQFVGKMPIMNSSSATARPGNVSTYCGNPSHIFLKYNVCIVQIKVWNIYLIYSLRLEQSNEC